MLLTHFKCPPSAKVNTSHIRRYHSLDFASCLNLFDKNTPTFFSRVERDGYVEFLQQAPFDYYVLEHLGQVVGCGGFECDASRKRAFLCWGMVHPDLQKIGLGKQLTIYRIEKIKALGCASSIFIDTSQRSLGFYERLGFKVIAIEPNGFGGGLDRIDMELNLKLIE